MFTDPWQFGLLAVLFTTNLAVSYWLYRRLRSAGGQSRPGPTRDRTDPTGGGPTTAERPAAEGDPVACPACGTPNDPTYRFCRACVAELSASGAIGHGAGDRAGGLPR
jgi:hypothetical protein